MRCPRCESSNGEDFFHNTVKQSRSVGGGDIYEGGLGSFEFDTKQWTCKKCMVRCISNQEFDRQKWEASLLNMTPEARKDEIARKDELKRIADKQAVKDMTPSEWGNFFFGLLIVGLVIAGIVFIIFTHSWDFSEA